MATAAADPRGVGISEPDPYVMWRRLRAIIIDSVIVGVLAHFTVAGFPVFHLRIQQPDGHNAPMLGFQSAEPVLLGVGFTAIFYMVYFLAFEALASATPGKVIAGLRVVDRWGMPASPVQTVLRDLVRPVDAAGAYTVGGLVAYLSRKRQRIGDHLAGTMVVSVESMADPRAAAGQVRRTTNAVIGLLVLVLLSYAISPLVPPALIATPQEHVYPIDNTRAIGISHVQSVHVDQIGVLDHTPAHAVYAIRLTLVLPYHRTVTCTTKASLQWFNPLAGWQYEPSWTPCRSGGQ